MKKTVKKLNLKNETIRQLGEKLATVRGGAPTIHSNEIGCSNGPTCYADDICTGGRSGACGGGGGTGSFATCFAAGCITIVSQ